MHRRSLLKCLPLAIVSAALGKSAFASPGKKFIEPGPHGIPKKICMLVRNTSGRPLLPNRLVRFTSSGNAVGYAGKGILGKLIGVTEKEILPGAEGLVVIHGSAKVQLG